MSRSNKERFNRFVASSNKAAVPAQDETNENVIRAILSFLKWAPIYYRTHSSCVKKTIESVDTWMTLTEIYSSLFEVDVTSLEMFLEKLQNLVSRKNLKMDEACENDTQILINKLENRRYPLIYYYTTDTQIAHLWFNNESLFHHVFSQEEKNKLSSLLSPSIGRQKMKETSKLQASLILENLKDATEDEEALMVSHFKFMFLIVMTWLKEEFLLATELKPELNHHGLVYRGDIVSATYFQNILSFLQANKKLKKDVNLKICEFCFSCTSDENVATSALDSFPLEFGMIKVLHRIQILAVPDEEISEMKSFYSNSSSSTVMAGLNLENISSNQSRKEILLMNKMLHITDMSEGENGLWYIDSVCLPQLYIKEQSVSSRLFNYLTDQNYFYSNLYAAVYETHCARIGKSRFRWDVLDSLKCQLSIGQLFASQYSEMAPYIVCQTLLTMNILIVMMYQFSPLTHFSLLFLSFLCHRIFTQQSVFMKKFYMFSALFPLLFAGVNDFSLVAGIMSYLIVKMTFQRESFRSTLCIALIIWFRCNSSLGMCLIDWSLFVSLLINSTNPGLYPTRPFFYFCVKCFIYDLFPPATNLMQILMCIEWAFTLLLPHVRLKHYNLKQISEMGQLLLGSFYSRDLMLGMIFNLGGVDHHKFAQLFYQLLRVLFAFCFNEFRILFFAPIFQLFMKLLQKMFTNSPIKTILCSLLLSLLFQYYCSTVSKSMEMTFYLSIFIHCTVALESRASFIVMYLEIVLYYYLGAFVPMTILITARIVYQIQTRNPK